MRHILDQLDNEILLLIGNQVNRNELLHEDLGQKNGKKVPKSTISRRTKKLAEMRLITSVPAFNMRIFNLTKKGWRVISNFVREGEGVIAFPIRGHGFQFKSIIVRKPKKLKEKLVKNGWVEYCPRNWRAYRGKALGCKVIFTTKSVLIYSPEVYGPNPEACLSEALSIVFKVMEELERTYEGLVLGKPEEVVSVISQSYARPLDPASIRFHEEGLRRNSTLGYRSDRLAVDNSKGFPELETTHSVYAPDDLNTIMSFYEDLIRNPFKLGSFLKEHDYLKSQYQEINRRISMIPLSENRNLSSSFTIDR